MDPRRRKKMLSRTEYPKYSNRIKGRSAEYPLRKWISSYSRPWIRETQYGLTSLYSVVFTPEAIASNHLRCNVSLSAVILRHPFESPDNGIPDGFNFPLGLEVAELFPQFHGDSDAERFHPDPLCSPNYTINQTDAEYTTLVCDIPRGVEMSVRRIATTIKYHSPNRRDSHGRKKSERKRKTGRGEQHVKVYAST